MYRDGVRGYEGQRNDTDVKEAVIFREASRGDGYYDNGKVSGLAMVEGCPRNMHSLYLVGVVVCTRLLYSMDNALREYRIAFDLLRDRFRLFVSTIPSSGVDLLSFSTEELVSSTDR